MEKAHLLNCLVSKGTHILLERTSHLTPSTSKEGWKMQSLVNQPVSRNSYILWEGQHGFWQTAVAADFRTQVNELKWFDHDDEIFLFLSISLISFFFLGTPLVAQMVKRLPTMRETQVQSLGQEDLLEKAMATHSSTLAWKIPWTEESGKKKKK